MKLHNAWCPHLYGQACRCPGVGRVTPSPPPTPVDHAIHTQAEVLERLPQWMWADFNCPDRGPHGWVGTQATGETRLFCKYCPAKRRIQCPDDMLSRDPLEVIYALQFSR